MAIQYVILFSSLIVRKGFEAASYMITDSVPAYSLWSRSEADKQNFADMKLSLHSTVTNQMACHRLSQFHKFIVFPPCNFQRLLNRINLWLSPAKTWPRTTPQPNLSSAAPPTDAWLPKGSRASRKHPPGRGKAAAAWLPVPAPVGIDTDAAIEGGQWHDILIHLVTSSCSRICCLEMSCNWKLI